MAPFFARCETLFQAGIRFLLHVSAQKRRLFLFLPLTVLGLVLVQQSAPVRAPVVGQSTAIQGTNRGNVGSATASRLPAAPGPCAVWDISCITTRQASTIAQGFYEAVRPLLEAIENDPHNILVTTPEKLTYGNETAVKPVVDWGLAVVDASLLVLIALVGYNILLVRSLGGATAGAMELLVRLFVAIGVAHAGTIFTKWYIDGHNAMCTEVLNLLQVKLIHQVFNTLSRTFLNPFADASLVLQMLLGLFLIGLLLYLLWQMLIRLATIVLLCATVPCLACLALPQTQQVARLWLSAFCTTVSIQLVQLIALALAGLFSNEFLNQGFLTLDPTTSYLLISCGIFALVGQLPGMVREYALRPTAQAANAVSGVATRLVAAL